MKWIASMVFLSLACQEPRKCVKTETHDHPAYQATEFDSATFLLLNIPMWKVVSYPAWSEIVCVQYEESAK